MESDDLARPTIQVTLNQEDNSAVVVVVFPLLDQAMALQKICTELFDAVPSFSLSSK